MSDDLFSDCKQDSPRLAWMKRHGIAVREATMYERVCVLESCGSDESDEFKFVASVSTKPSGSLSAYGPTPDDAMAGVARAANIPLWNEEAYINGNRS